MKNDTMDYVFGAMSNAEEAISKSPKVTYCVMDNDNDDGEIVFVIGDREFVLTLKETT